MRRSQSEVVFEACRSRLVRHVRLKDNRSYTQHCTLAVFEEVVRLARGRHHERIVGSAARSAVHADLHRLGVPEGTGLRGDGRPAVIRSVGHAS
jgi:hypothetical protein